MALNETQSSNTSSNAVKNSNGSSSNSSGGKESKCCVECKKPIKGKFVRALEGMFHMDCFRCMVSFLHSTQHFDSFPPLLLELDPFEF